MLLLTILAQFLILGARNTVAAAAVTPTRTTPVVNWDATGLIVPLYSFPASNATWDPLLEAITTHPRLPFYIVVNPNEGPGSEAGLSYEYAAQIVRLKQNANVELLGYVTTYHGIRNSAEIRRDIRIYKEWPDWHAVDGIYFDQVQDDNMSLYYGLTNFVMMEWNLDATIILNPGKTPIEEYYELADQIVTFEDPFGDFDPSHIHPDYAYQQSVLIHSFPQGDKHTLLDTVHQLKEDGVGSLYVTDVNSDDMDVYGSFGSLLMALADAVEEKT